MTICPSCGQENPEGFLLCGMCGTRLAAAAPGLEERKLVSVLFVDIVGSTQHADQADPEDVRATLRPYHARVKREIERFGGTVEKFVGDAVMAVFGAPAAHEDDPERAVRAALRVLESVEDLELRAAVTTGEALVTVGARPEAGEGIVAGDVVNIASRLQQAAPVGALVVDEVTQRTTSGAIDYERLEPVVLKGKAEPIEIWRALGARSRYGVDVDRGLPTPFVGRQRELSLLEGVYGRALEEPSVQLVTVVGEPGVGKTRLVSELHALVDDRPEIVYWRQARCLPYGEGITFWALGEIVKAHGGILESDSPEQAAAKLSSSVDALVEQGSDREWLEGRLGPLVGVTGPEGAGAAEREELFAAWQRYVEAIAAERPLVLVFEDLHWADEPMLAFIEHVVDWATGVPLLCLCSARPELFERSEGWGGGKRNSTTIALSPLTGDETEALVTALLEEHASISAETRAALLERASGNPLYAEQFVRMVSEREGGNGEVAVPETVQALIAARLDTLPRERKTVVQDASVVGKVFWTGAVASVGGLEDHEIQLELRELVRKELVRPARLSSIEGQEEFSFWHLLVQDVAYQQIPRGERARKHLQAAAWIERLAGTRTADHSEILVHHYGQALELARASGDDALAGEAEQPLRGFLVLAGDRVMALDLHAAEQHYRRALELFSPSDPDRADVLVKVAETMQEQGRLLEAERAFEEAIPVLESADRQVRAGAATTLLARALWRRGETARGLELAEKNVQVLERGEPGRELVAAYSQVGSFHAIGGRSREGLEWAERGLGLAEQLGLLAPRVRLLQMRGIARCDLDDLGGLDDLRAALDLGLELGLGVETAIAYGNLGDLLSRAEGPAKGLELSQASLEFSEQRGLTHNVMWQKGEVGRHLTQLGRWDEALPLLDEVITWDRRQGGTQIATWALEREARIFAYRGELAEARRLASGVLPRAREIGDLQVLAPALATAALIEDKVEAAVELIEELDKATRGSPAWRASELPTAARVCAGAGAVESAERLLEGTDGVAMPYDLNAVLTGRAVVAEARGEIGPAAELYAEAARRWREFGTVPECAHALFGQGRCLLELKRAEEAAAPFEEAARVFGDLGAEPLARAARDGLAQATARAAK